ncbi:MAG: GAF and ANTAR domain-containing protein [Ornithinimicrobium sp.]
MAPRKAAATVRSAAGPLIAPVQVPVAEQMANLAEALMKADGMVGTAQVVAEAACSLIPGTEDASVSLARRGVGIDTIAWHGALPEPADAAQVITGQGPCIEAAWERRLARLNDTQTDQQWPKFSAKAKDLGVGSMLSLQLSLPREPGDDRIGAINCYARTPHAFGRDSESIGLFLAVHSAVGVGAAEREEQLRHALDSRDVIGQAKGMIMAHQGLSAEAAFAIMVRQARDTNTRMSDLATRLVARAAS